MSAPEQIDTIPGGEPITSLLDIMVDEKEFESIVGKRNLQVDFIKEIRRAIKEIEDIRNRPLICYISNTVNQSLKTPIGISFEDDLPFSEMVNTVSKEKNEVDILHVTPGGSAQQVDKFVEKLRPRFNRVAFLLPCIAMSAGTIFVMSGDEIIMGPNAFIGPIDPQVANKEGRFVPAQSLLHLIEEIRKRGEKKLANGRNPDWTDILLLKEIDAKEIGSAMTASEYSIELVKKYLYQYKFKYWKKHSSTGQLVQDEEKSERSKEIAKKLCDHSEWKSHSRGITREAAWQDCRIKITHSETIKGLEKSMRRFWALVYFVFENNPITKMFISSDYCIIRNDPSFITRR